MLYKNYYILLYIILCTLRYILQVYIWSSVSEYNSIKKDEKQMNHSKWFPTDKN